MSIDAKGERDALHHRALGHPRRLRLLQLLEGEGPLDVHELAARLGLRPNGVRRHLQLLVRAGLVDAAHARGGGRPGRPRHLYAAARRERNGYPLLADMLAGTLARGGGPNAVDAEGRAWGRRLVGPAGDTLTALLDRLGFAPTTTSTEQGVRVDIHRCPFLDTARVHPGVVCSLHLGLMRGALAELGAPFAAERLDPLVEPTLCVGHLRRIE